MARAYRAVCFVFSPPDKKRAWSRHLDSLWAPAPTSAAAQQQQDCVWTTAQVFFQEYTRRFLRVGNWHNHFICYQLFDWGGGGAEKWSAAVTEDNRLGLVGYHLHQRWLLKESAKWRNVCRFVVSDAVIRDQSGTFASYLWVYWTDFSDVIIAQLLIGLCCAVITASRVALYGKLTKKNRADVQMPVCVMTGDYEHHALPFNWFTLPPVCECHTWLCMQLLPGVSSLFHRDRLHVRRSMKINSIKKKISEDCSSILRHCCSVSLETVTHLASNQDYHTVCLMTFEGLKCHRTSERLWSTGFYGAFDKMGRCAHVHFLWWQEGESGCRRGRDWDRDLKSSCWVFPFHKEKLCLY